MKRRKDLTPEPQPEQAGLERQVESLRRDIRHLQLEHDRLKKASEIIKKGLGVSLLLLTNREKPMLVDALKQTHALSDILKELGLARSSYFYHRTRVQAAESMRVRAVRLPTSSNSITVATATAGCRRR